MSTLTVTDQSDIVFTNDVIAHLDAQLASARRLLARAGARLGIAPSAVSISLLDAVIDPQRVDEAHARSAELRGMLVEIQREHHVNRALMNQELAFLDHLLRLADSDRHLGYDSAGDHNRMRAPRLASRHRVLDLEV